jgi:quinoprotein dehydrogenase-associated probable ABC transporter substrate-binding protein
MFLAIRSFGAFIVAACCAAPVMATPLRVCADPNNLPFSNDKQEGFENQIAGLIAKDLGMQLTYFWFPQRGAFFRKTLNAGVCDVVMGVPSGFEEAAATQPYYRSTYAFITRRDRNLHIDSLEDPRLRNLKIGVHVLGEQDDSIPPVNALIKRGIVHNLVGFSIFGNLNEKNPPSDLIKAVEDGKVDVAIAWGPLAGYFSRNSAAPLDVTPVSDDPANPQLPFHFDIGIGVREKDVALKKALDEELTRRHSDIDKILQQFGIPQLPIATQLARSSED